MNETKDSTPTRRTFGSPREEKRLKTLLKKKHATILDTIEKLRETENERERERMRAESLRKELESLRRKTEEPKQSTKDVVTPKKSLVFNDEDTVGSEPRR